MHQKNQQSCRYQFTFIRKCRYESLFLIRTFKANNVWTSPEAKHDPSLLNCKPTLDCARQNRQSQKFSLTCNFDNCKYNLAEPRCNYYNGRSIVTTRRTHCYDFKHEIENDQVIFMWAPAAFVAQNGRLDVSLVRLICSCIKLYHDKTMRKS